MIGNVAVSKGWRRRGIARSLISAAIDLARGRRGEWIALQVRSDSEAAKNLYVSLDFKAVGETMQFRRTRPFVSIPSAPMPGEEFRRGRAADAHRIYALAQAAIPQELRWAEPLRRDDFWLGPDRTLGNWLSGRREAWRVIASDMEIKGAAHLELPRRPHYDGRLRVWVSPGYQGRYEDRLVRAVLSSVNGAMRRSMSATVPAEHAAARQALEAAGFVLRRRLTHMRLELKGRSDLSEST
jgi:ribosomal protein S18 acetylase RimI-like enzyme